MDPVFTLPYAESCVAQQLTPLLHTEQGYRTFVPASRQKPGIDLVLARRTGGRTRVATIQVKASRTYTGSMRVAVANGDSHPAVTARSRGAVRKRAFRYDTWFKTFVCPPEADFFALLALYPARDAQERRELSGWWARQILLFTQREMRQFLRSVRTVGGQPDRMFGFGFDEPRHVYQTRGDQHRRGRDYSSHLLDRRIGLLHRFLATR